MNLYALCQLDWTIIYSGEEPLPVVCEDESDDVVKGAC